MLKRTGLCEVIRRGLFFAQGTKNYFFHTYLFFLVSLIYISQCEPLKITFIMLYT